MKAKRPHGLRKNVTITLIQLDRTRATRRLRTNPGQLMTPEGLDALLEREAALVEKHFPGREFRLVPLRGDNFNFVEFGVSADPDEDSCRRESRSSGAATA